MEKKTIGGFIAALRKANGMTQKDLAERLNVSDKTVSRWERDDGAPDLAAIPAIAEIFGVTCDELLRGERKSPEERTVVSEENETTPKGEKQRQRLLKSTLSQYKNHTYIAMGITVVGMIVALVCNLAFLKAILGFFLGAIFFAASIVCQAVFVNKAFFSVEDAGLDANILSDFKRKVIGLAEKSIGLTVAFIGFTFPLILVDAYMGLGSDSLLIWGAMGAAAFLLIYAIVLYFLNASLLKKGTYSLSERESTIYQHKMKNPVRVTETEVAEAMNYAHGDGQGHTPGRVSNKTLYIALNYKEQAERLNTEAAETIAAELFVLEHEHERLKLYISLIDKREAEVLMLLYSEKESAVNVAERLGYSKRTITRIHNAAVAHLAEMYEYAEKYDG